MAGIQDLEICAFLVFNPDGFPGPWHEWVEKNIAAISKLMEDQLITITFQWLGGSYGARGIHIPYMLPI